MIAQSATLFAAAAEVEVDLTTAEDGVVRAPSAYHSPGEEARLNASSSSRPAPLRPGLRRFDLAVRAEGRDPKPGSHLPCLREYW